MSKLELLRTMTRAMREKEVSDIYLPFALARLHSDAHEYEFEKKFILLRERDSNI